MRCELIMQPFRSVQSPLCKMRRNLLFRVVVYDHFKLLFGDRETLSGVCCPRVIFFLECVDQVLADVCKCLGNVLWVCGRGRCCRTGSDECAGTKPFVPSGFQGPCTQIVRPRERLRIANMTTIRHVPMYDEPRCARLGGLFLVYTNPPSVLLHKIEQLVQTGATVR